VFVGVRGPVECQLRSFVTNLTRGSSLTSTERRWRLAGLAVRFWYIRSCLAVCLRSLLRWWKTWLFESGAG